MNLLGIEMTTDARQPIEWVPVAPMTDGHPCPDAYRERVIVDVIHDGNNLPEKFLLAPDGRRLLGPGPTPAEFIEERDWGAELMAHSLSSALHLDGYLRVNTARVLLDFGRFPGITPRYADHMTRMAINYPFSVALSHAQKRALLEDYYDGISSGMDAALGNRLVKIAIHTYDAHNPTAGKRPAVSILTRPYGHQHLFIDPVRRFDPSFPDELAQFTADRLLRARMAITLEEAAIHAADNFPYSLPEGSVEVRGQVWYFFRHVQKAFERRWPRRGGTADDARQRVWDMLLDTNLRSAECDALRSYLHMFRRPPRGLEQAFVAARAEYENIVSFIRLERARLVDGYRNDANRPSTILIEIRKDLVWRFEDGVPKGPKVRDAERIARVLARAVQAYLAEDLPAKAEALANGMERYD